ncbi:MAG: hypothetical protein K2O99_10130 [Lachnospiraceae bacterium]|nr:hypothetical protein [Lachnospiraceae bacterium]
MSGTFYRKNHRCTALLVVLGMMLTACGDSMDKGGEGKAGMEAESQELEAADPAIAPDLNRNGITEEVRLTDFEDGQGQRLEIWEDDALLYRLDGYFAHTGQESIFLCTLDGEDYLLRYYPQMYQGVCTYGYELFTLVDNEPRTEQSRAVEFDINFGSPVHGGFDVEAIAEFMEAVNTLFAHSVLLLNTNVELQETFVKEGRLYDSLWWLDNQEPEFVRDKGRTLQENLKEYQAAMTFYSGFYSPDAAGHALEYQLWMHGRHGFDRAGDTLVCWGLQNMESDRGFFAD